MNSKMCRGIDEANKSKDNFVFGQHVLGWYNGKDPVKGRFVEEDEETYLIVTDDEKQGIWFDYCKPDPDAPLVPGQEVEVSYDGEKWGGNWFYVGQKKSGTHVAENHVGVAADWDHCRPARSTRTVKIEIPQGAKVTVNGKEIDYE